MANQDFSRTLEQGGESGFNRSKRWFARFHLDLPLLMLLIILAVGGLFVLYSSSGANLVMTQKQILHFLVGFTLLILSAQIPPRFYASIAPWPYFICLIGLIAVLFFGVGAKGARRKHHRGG